MNLLVMVIELIIRILDSLDAFYVLLGLLLGKSKSTNAMSQPCHTVLLRFSLNTSLSAIFGFVAVYKRTQEYLNILVLLQLGHKLVFTGSHKSFLLSTNLWVNWWVKCISEVKMVGKLPHSGSSKFSSESLLFCS